VSKHAVLGLTKTLARELGPSNIRVNAILPGWINNARGRKVVVDKAKALGVPEEDLIAEMAEFISLGCMIEPQELADMALYLASSHGRHISGQLIGVCGNVEYER
jgi:NAD(P)-dependent dehydrogenase (short-subunit alcohol dehydrogenase family)